MRVLYLIYHAGNGGSEKYVYDLCVEMQRREGNPFLGYCIRGKLVDDLEKLGIPCFQVDMPSFHNLNAILRLKKLIKEHDIHLVHAQFSRENYLACFAKLLGAKVDVIYTSHMVNEDGHVKRVLNAVVGKLNKKIIAVSKAVWEDLKNANFPTKKLALIYNGITLPKADLTPSEKERGKRIMLESFGVSSVVEDELLLVNVSRFSPEKGLDYLLTQFKAAYDENKALRLLLVGDGAQKDDIVNQIKELGLQEVVVLTGYQNHPLTLISCCDIYVSSSRMESLGYSILEAMSCAIPVIATDVGGCKELVNDNSDCGYLVPFGSDTFSKKILELSLEKDRRIEFGRNARAFVEKNFQKENMMEETFALYNSKV